MKTLTSIEKKELKNWAKLNNIDLSFNKKLEFGRGFWKDENIFTLKSQLMNLESIGDFRLKALTAVGSDYISYDLVTKLGNENGLELIEFEGKEYWIKFSSMIYINGFLAINKKLLK